MKSVVRIAVIFCILIVTIVICAFIGGFKATSAHDSSGFVASGYIFLGIFGAVISLIFGVFISFLLRHKTDGYYSLLGYVVPSVGTILIALLAN